MKTASSALIVAVGLILLWIITSGRSKNLASAWATLVGDGKKTGSSNGLPGLPQLPGLQLPGMPGSPQTGPGGPQPYGVSVPPWGGLPVPSSAGPTNGIPQGPWTEQWPSGGGFQIPAPGGGQ